MNNHIDFFIATLWAIANADPALTAPPQQEDWIPAAIEPATGPAAENPIALSTPMIMVVVMPMLW